MIQNRPEEKINQLIGKYYNKQQYQGNQWNINDHHSKDITFSAKWRYTRWSRHLALYLDMPKTEIYNKLMHLRDAYRLHDIEYCMSVLEDFHVFPGFPFLLSGSFNDHIHYVCNYLAQTKRRKVFFMTRSKMLPKVPFIAFHKTASSFISVVLCRLFKIQPTILSYRHTYGVLSWLRAFHEWGGVVHDHYSPSPSNIQLFHEAGLKKCVIHRRNPVAIIISLANDFIESLPMNSKPTNETDRVMLIRSFLDCEMENFVWNYGRWLRNWRKEAQEGRLQILETSYEEMKQDQATFFKRLLTFIDTPYEQATLDKILKDLDFKKKNKVYNFRKASPNEWREVLTAKQLDRWQELIAKEIPEYSQ